ncbi:MAG TPA: glycosyltransferase, partial [Planctomycetota bacterium]|nr:glycosyltransferase [Planctomycetota bacterium]
HTSTPRESRIDWQPFLPFERMLELYQSSRITVTHAGTGSVMTSLRSGRMPIVVPRYAALGEHVDDHQVEFTEALAQKGLVIPVYRDGSLEEAIEIANRAGAPKKLDPNRIPDILSEFVRSLGPA